MSSQYVARGPDDYDRQMGRWSRRLAEPFLAFAGCARGERVLDVGCGTGNLAFRLLKEDVAAVSAIDFDVGFVEAVRRRNTDPRLEVQQGDACQLPFADASFDRALSMLVFHFVSDAAAAVGELHRVVRPGGVAAATVWDTYGGMPSVRAFWDTVCAIEPMAREQRTRQAMRPMTRAGELADALRAAGFVDVVDTLLTIRMDFADFQDYWVPATALHGATANFFASLDASTRERIEAAVRDAYLSGQPDGPRSFVAAAWAARGVKPRSAGPDPGGQH